MVPLFLQCDGAWWLPLTWLSSLPYTSALVHRVVMVTLHARLLCSRLHYLSRHLSQAHLHIVDEFNRYLQQWLMSLTAIYNSGYYDRCLNQLLKHNYVGLPGLVLGSAHVKFDI